LWARTILLVKFSVFFLLIHNSFARETFEFNLGQKINVLSDKAYRKTAENEFEAVGNVVITHLKNSIYGEKARLNFNTGETEVEGNVRYISPGITLYGTKLKYNFNTREIDLTNARILSDSYSVVGKNIYQVDSKEIIAEDAEYSTCRDCPESWSVFGKTIKITLGNYVRIKHAYIKINGVIAMYVPYIVFPIKKKRESGLLFPVFNYKTTDGLKFQVPYFWAISDYSDLTFVPSVFGNRGFGEEIQFRQNFKEKNWLQFNSMGLNDKVYEPYKTTKELSGETHFRQFSDLEFHSGYKHYINGHFYLNDTSDLDMKRDFTTFTNDKILGTEIGGGGFFDFRNSNWSLTTEGYYNQNMFVSNPKNFDNQYVQILPKLSLNSVPYNLFHSTIPFLKNISVGWDSDATIFKQNHPVNTGYIRNAQRLNLAPYLDWQLGNIGPIYFSHQTKWDFQNYRFPYEDDKKFQKRGFVFETEGKILFEKIFGISYQEEIPVIIDPKATVVESNMIGGLPSYQIKVDEVTKTRAVNSYRHSQEFKLKHYYLTDQKSSGNQNFLNQIAKDDGQFDYVDAIRAKEHISNQITAQDSLPVSNTVEFQWNNTITRKMANKMDPFVDGKFLKDNFLYSNIFYFDVSQGIDFNIQSTKLNDRLTRLYLNAGMDVDNKSVSVQEFYFHQTSEHKLSTTFSFNFDKSKFGGKFTYNSFNSSNTPISKLIGTDLSLYLNDLFTFKNVIDYNIQTKQFADSSYALIYSPLNNCWKIEIDYSKDLIEKKIGFVLYINYSENNFASINIH
jgi:LPS-assembly protein